MEDCNVRLSVMDCVLRNLKLALSLAMKLPSSSLSFFIDWTMETMFLFLIPMCMIRGTWLEGFHNSGARVCCLNHGLSGARKTKSRTELDSQGLSANLVGPGLDSWDSSRLRLSAMNRRFSVWLEWW